MATQHISDNTPFTYCSCCLPSRPVSTVKTKKPHLHDQSLILLRKLKASVNPLNQRSPRIVLGP